VTPEEEEEEEGARVRGVAGRTSMRTTRDIAEGSRVGVMATARRTTATGEESAPLLRAPAIEGTARTVDDQGLVPAMILWVSRSLPARRSPRLLRLPL